MIDNNLLTNIKHYSLPNILADLGIHPASKASSDGRKALLYRAPYRDDTHPSLSVFCHDGKWLYKDHASGNVGTSLDLLVQMGEFSDWRQAAGYVAHRYLGVDINSTAPMTIPNIHPNYISPKNEEKSYPGTILSVMPIVGSHAEMYVTDIRRIPVNVAAKYLSFVTYNYPSRPIDRPLSGIGWKTFNGGWSIRWAADLGKGAGKTFVGASGPSFIPAADDVRTPNCMVFEGMFDFLSFIADNEGVQVDDALILNSAENAENAIPIIAKYDSIHCYPDNDASGKKALAVLINNHHSVVDMSFLYDGYKDYNDFWKTSLKQ